MANAAKQLPQMAECVLSFVKKFLVNGGYSGERFANQVKDLCGAQVEVVKRSELHKFVVLPRPWVVERLFGWLDKFRRLSTQFAVSRWWRE